MSHRLTRPYFGAKFRAFHSNPREVWSTSRQVDYHSLSARFFASQVSAVTSPLVCIRMREADLDPARHRRRHGGLPVHTRRERSRHGARGHHLHWRFGLREL